MLALILAGGGGTRLWPVSRQATPKQIESFTGGDSMLRATFDRLCAGFEPRDIFVATSAAQAQVVRAQLPELPEANLILEPCRRDTASAIGFALLQISRSRADETFVLINSDAHIKDVAAYHRAIKSAGCAVKENGGQTVLIGLTPLYPETGYGYIKAADRMKDVADLAVYKVERFVEKPDLATAEKYLADGHYFWNPTLIVAPVAGFLSAYVKFLPDHAAIFNQMRDCFGADDEQQKVDQLFARLPSISVDYGILEKEKNLLVMPADFGWMDIGNWRTVREMLARDDKEDVVQGRHLGIDSSGNFIHTKPGKLVATIGLSDMVIVDTDDALLICPQTRAHEVKHVVERLKKDEAKEFL